MSEYYNEIKALHLIFVITWFAALFYMPRLFIYHIEAAAKSPGEREILTRQLKVMSRRLWTIIAWPSAILTTVFAIWLLVLMPSWLQQPWMHVKLSFVLLLIAYHLKTNQMYLQLQHDRIRYGSRFMRMWNEVATLLLFAIVFLAVLKNEMNWRYGLLALGLLVVILFFGIRIYRFFGRR